MVTLSLRFQLLLLQHFYGQFGQMVKRTKELRRDNPVSPQSFKESETMATTQSSTYGNTMPGNPAQNNPTATGGGGTGNNAGNTHNAGGSSKAAGGEGGNAQQNAQYHSQAATHCQKAHQAHKDAADSYDAGDHKTAQDHAKMASDHLEKAQQCGQKAMSH